jgi:hypothetical protein
VYFLLFEQVTLFAFEIGIAIQLKSMKPQSKLLFYRDLHWRVVANLLDDSLGLFFKLASGITVDPKQQFTHLSLQSQDNPFHHKLLFSCI